MEEMVLISWFTKWLMMMLLLLRRASDKMCSNPFARSRTKNYKVVIDGGSYNNIITSDLVHVLGISSWRQPQPYYV